MRTISDCWNLVQSRTIVVDTTKEREKEKEELYTNALKRIYMHAMNNAVFITLKETQKQTIPVLAKHRLDYAAIAHARVSQICIPGEFCKENVEHIVSRIRVYARALGCTDATIMSPFHGCLPSVIYDTIRKLIDMYTDLVSANPTNSIEPTTLSETRATKRAKYATEDPQRLSLAESACLDLIERVDSLDAMVLYYTSHADKIQFHVTLV